MDYTGASISREAFRFGYYGRGFIDAGKAGTLRSMMGTTARADGHHEGRTPTRCDRERIDRPHKRRESANGGSWSHTGTRR